MGDVLYDEDFYTWTQDQAEKLRALRGDNRLDVDNLAEEVADLGRSELNKVDSHLREVLVHLLKLAWIPAERLHPGWLDEVLRHQDDARKAFTPGMRQRLDIEHIWQRAWRQADSAMKAYGDPSLPERPGCPFDLDDLLAETFEADAGRDRLVSLLASD